MERKVFTIWLIAITTFLICTTATHAEMYLEPWEFKSDMTVGRNALSGATVGEYFYSIGGVVMPGSPSDAQNVVERYNHITDTWTKLESMPTARHSLDCAVIDGYIYAIGGHVANSRSENQRYDPVSNTWQSMASKPTAVSGLGVTDFDGKIYTFGGNRYGSIQSIIEVYDPITNTWGSVGNMPAAGQPWRAVTLGDKIYLAGGHFLSEGGISDHLWAYDPASGTWDTSLPNLNVARCNHELVVVGDYLFAIGGSGPLSSVEWWTPGATEWTLAEPLNIARRSFGAGALGNTLYAFGGYNEGDLSSTESTAVVPTPGAAVLGVIGLGFANWCLRKRREL